MLYWIAVMVIGFLSGATGIDLMQVLFGGNVWLLGILVALWYALKFQDPLFLGLLLAVICLALVKGNPHVSSLP
jgi:hypothetical protein